MADPGYLSSQKDEQEEGDEPGLLSETLPQTAGTTTEGKETQHSNCTELYS